MAAVISPLRISIVTYNIWLTKRWARRAPALEKFLRLFDPDILALQELQPRSRGLIDRTLAAHERVDDRFRGWSTESNIYWRAALFSGEDHGAEDVGIDQGSRRLFWVRLRRADGGGSVVIATAHLTHQRAAQESRTGRSPRVRQVSRVISALGRIAREDEPVFFMGDMNDPMHPTHQLHDAGYTSCFGALGLVPPSTFKCYPTADVEPGMPPVSQCVDWLYANARARAVAATVPQFFFRDSAPSDHWPVQAVYEIPPSPL
jgi:endonuclease/exonuclease/phosphatase family metal-dependent hydrolase